MEQSQRKGGSCLATLVFQILYLGVSTLLGLGMVWLLTLAYPVVNPSLTELLASSGLPYWDTILVGIWVGIPFVVGGLIAFVLSLLGQLIRRRRAA